MIDGSLLRTASGVDAFSLFGIFGALGVFIDLDHIPVLLAKGLPITTENLITHGARPLHLPVFFLVGMLCIISAAHVYRLHRRQI